MTTIQRWEAGKNDPGLAGSKRLRNLLDLLPAKNHELLSSYLALSHPVAFLDEYAVYTRVNGPFLKLFEFGDRAEVVGNYCSEISRIWEEEVPNLTKLQPEMLLFGSFESVEIKKNVYLKGRWQPVVHRISAVRQSAFARVLLHEVEKDPF